jgi:hypothetical protein
MRAKVFLHSTAFTIAAITSLAAAGCAVDATAPAPAQAESTGATSPTVAAGGKILAQIAAQGRSTITFREGAPGEIVVDESVPAGAEPRLARAQGATVLDTYRNITGGQEPPTELVEAESKRLETKASAPVAPATHPVVPPVERPSNEPLVTPLTTSGQQNFVNSFCGSGYPLYDYLRSCVTGTTIVQTQGQTTQTFQAEGYSDPSSSGPGEFYYYWWNGSTWVQQWAFTLNPGGYDYFIVYGGTPLERVALTLAGGPVAAAAYAWSPGVSAEYYNALFVQASGFKFDSQVQLYLEGGPLLYPYPVGTPSVTNGSISDYQATYPCYSSYAYPNANFTLVAQGKQTGTTASTMVSAPNCW